MAHIEKATTKRTRDGKLQPTYRVRWMEPDRDELGRAVPYNLHRPDGQKRQRHRQESFASKEAAQERCDQLNAARHYNSAQTASEARKAGDEALGHYAAAWLESLSIRVHRGALKASTLAEYRRLVNCYVTERFGSMPVASITPRHCEQFLADLAAKGISPKTTKHAWSTLSRVLRYTTTHGAIAASPADRVDFGRGHGMGDHEKFEHNPLTAEQVGHVAAVVGERYPIYALMTLFLAYSGLRSAECAGLEVGDIEFKTFATGARRCAVNVRRTKTRRVGAWETSTPKSKRSRRTVPLPPWLADLMQAYLTDDVGHADAHPDSANPAAPLWPSRGVGGNRTLGKPTVAPLRWAEPIAMGTYYETILRPAYEQAGLPISRPARPAVPATDGTPAVPAVRAVRGVRLHDLRATFATMQLMSGVHFMQVSRWLGHASFTLTLDTYGDWIPEEDGGAGNQLPEPSGPEPTATSIPERSNVVPLFGRRSAG